MEKQIIVLERTFNTSITKVWKALTDVNEMKAWYFDLKEFRAEIGFTFQFTGGPDAQTQFLHICEVTEAIPNKKLTYSWRYDGYAGISYVTFELFEQGNKTLLKLTHRGIETFPQNNPNFILSNFQEGWDAIINIALQKHLEPGNYQTIIQVNATPPELFAAITQHIPEWWSRDFDGLSANVKDEFTVRFGRTFKTMRLTQTVTDKQVEWLCIAQHIEMPAGMPPMSNPSEWVGNRIVWEITANDDGAILSLLHIGLTPFVECWSVCEPGWNQTLQSLSQFLSTGTGRPFEQLDDEHLEKAKKLYQSNAK